ncbi:hypothetical protein ACOMICROBIO_FLGHMIGD_01764 [Vibrio sp. B1FLJ16]|uniref:DNA phosphorothioation-associated protein 4 n=1 Tax=Vibrio sp. B1FLJ16 TaxID=2751178 RepID=UPI0015F3E9E1|nr:DNA phosphorothioation-associated protein 4 [Vibrio sp. B1FLJ16]CAD7808008.1 hypothetical protein ACOMICROBIO_FLGHMIGD_01764 [Vibrio sp. B1FLJ16]CAE6906017.1 hypothetical protein ACOMICROBIO_FLGHMIGD_01764 [Vibrio sp. B1FLJ16]
MIDRRIQFDKDKQSLIELLCSGEEHKKVFSSMADCLSFAAAYGFFHNERKKIEKASSNPIKFNVFENSSHDTLVYLLAMKDEKDAHILAEGDDNVNKRATIFEEYANGGLERLSRELAGTLESLDHFLLIINKELLFKNNSQDGSDSFNLGDLEI